MTRDNIASDEPNGNVGLSGARLLQLGYTHLVPIIPPNVPVAFYLQSSIRKGRDPRGKMPGVSRNGVWSGFFSWQTHVPTEVEVSEWDAMGAGIGLAGDGEIVFLDIDAKELKTADAIEADALKALGPAPLRVGAWPKRALLYRVSDDVPSRVMTYSAGDRTDRVELLARGKQLVAVGVHPGTKRPYNWPRPLVRKTDLTTVTAAMLDSFFAQQKQKLPRATMARNVAGTDRSKVDQKSLKGELSLVRRAVASLPNSIELFPEYIDMIRVGMAIHAALPDELEEGREIWHDWAEKWEGGDYDYDVADAHWRSFQAPHALGAGYLYRTAHRHGDGSFNIAEFYFEPVVDEAHFEDEPLDLFSQADPGDLATPPIDALPPIIARWAIDQARRKGTSLAFTSAAAIAAAGGAIGNSLLINLRLKDGQWTQPAPLWMILVAKPGSTKSEVIKVAMAPLRELEREWRRTDEPKRDEWQKKSKGPGRRKDAELHAIGPRPKVRRLTLDDVTMEAQIAIHAENPRGLIRDTDELAGMLEKMGAYKNSPGGDRSNMLRLYDGGGVSVDRMGSGSFSADSALMGCVAGTQPEKLRPIVKNLSSDGMLQRMLFILGQDIEYEDVDEEPDHEAIAAYRQLLRFLASANYGKEKTVRLSPAAAEVLKNFRHKCKRLKRLPGASDAWLGHLAKWDNFAARIMLTFYAIEHGELLDWTGPVEPVSEQTAARAIAFCDFLLRHSLAIYESYFGYSAPASEARLFAGYLLAHPEVTEFRPRDVYQARTNLKGRENRKLLFEAIAELEEAGWCVMVERAHDGPTLWKVNSRIHVRFAEQGKREAAERARRQEQIRVAGAERKRLVGRDGINSHHQTGGSRHDGDLG